ncbi:MAG: YihA family ribosome biogenesis GTP-binding protein [Opitutaceae bacterium]|nr:YihA family ribosome biogenesis GTP-binding protein [Opitutaceae bacterium]
MKIKSAEYQVSAPDAASCPAWGVPEFAFVGRSNVGKSSLINLLTHRKDLAKVSATPGKTRLLNFFLINGEWGLVDMPGYGFAVGGKDGRIDFSQVIAHYAAERANLRCIFVLIDSRHPPQQIDLEFIRWVEGTGVPFALVFTKTDKLGPTRLKANLEDYKKTIATWRSELPDILACSAHDGTGKHEILGYISARMARPAGAPAGSGEG